MLIQFPPVASELLYSTQIVLLFKVIVGNSNIVRKLIQPAASAEPRGVLWGPVSMQHRNIYPVAHSEISPAYVLLEENGVFMSPPVLFSRLVWMQSPLLIKYLKVKLTCLLFLHGSILRHIAHLFRGGARPRACAWCTLHGVGLRHKQRRRGLWLGSSPQNDSGRTQPVQLTTASVSFGLIKWLYYLRLFYSIVVLCVLFIFWMRSISQNVWCILYMFAIPKGWEETPKWISEYQNRTQTDNRILKYSCPTRQVFILKLFWSLK